MKREIYNIDVKDKILGRVATQVALLLRGKNQVNYNPRLDNGAVVIIKNVDKMKFTGGKLQKKVYKHHTGYQGNLKINRMAMVYQKNPQQVFIRAVYHMLPKNKLRPEMIKRLKFE